MKALFHEIKTSLLATLLFALLLCGLYPFLVWGGASLIFPDQAHGSLIQDHDKILGSKLLGQSFSSPTYFHSRPSAAGKGYDASLSSGSNLGPTSQKFIDGVKANIALYREINGLTADIKIPADAVTASASGLDPHISPRNAELQASRVARERGLTRDAIEALIAKHREGPFLGIIGEETVNVLTLNLELDKANTN